MLGRNLNVLPSHNNKPYNPKSFTPNCDVAPSSCFPIISSILLRRNADCDNHVAITARSKHFALVYILKGKM
jgi:hypothetical protein